MTPVLQVRDLHIEYRVHDRWLNAVRGVTFDLARGEVLGLVGESGCGKSTLARALIRLLPGNGRIASGKVQLGDLDFLGLSETELLKARWAKVSMVFQGAMNVLDPVYTIGSQIVEAIATHRRDMSKREMWTMAEDLVEIVGIERSRTKSYPHELSGGMRQRIGIAMAIALQPDLVIADEPTTALDVISQDNVLARLTALQRERAFSMILVSHDMGVIAETCDRVAVMYAGQIVELGTVRDIFHRPAHPYAIGLRGAIPTIGSEEEVIAIPGTPPAAYQRDDGCQFRHRCPFATDLCAKPAPWSEVGEGHFTLCHYPEKAEEMRAAASRPETWDAVATRQQETLARQSK